MSRASVLRSSSLKTVDVVLEDYEIAFGVRFEVGVLRHVGDSSAP